MTPPPAVVEAFGGDVGDVVHVGEGVHGGAWRAGSVVLKRGGPCDAECDLWASIASTLDQSLVRVAAPARAVGGSWRVDGWSASTWVEGRAAGAGEWSRALDASDALHEALARLDVAWPRDLDERTDPWAIADREVWAGKRRGDEQVVDGDVAGNVVLADGEPPGVIDLALYYRPAAYARATTVLDLVTWWSAPRSLLASVDAGMLERARRFRALVDELRATSDAT